ncbi:MAG: hypothetical protein ABJA49_07070 [Betaproteobacteria bacterium]
MHALPRLDGSDVNLQRTRLGRWKMLLVLLICAAPVVASYFAYYVVRPQTRSVFGTLVEPQRPLPDLVGVAPDGAKSNLRALKGQWLLITVSGGACDAMCQQYLYMQRQLRESLGKDKDRVDRVWLVNDDSAIDPALLPALNGAVVLRVPPAELANWLAPQQGHGLAEHLYLVDPIGNWMMRFPAALDLKGAAKAKRDVERVLRASASWDEAGR